MTREIVARAPTRIDLGGGWTDVPPYCDREGGFVCNVAIDRYAVVRLSDAPIARATRDETPLVRATMRRAGLDVSASVASDFPIGAGLGGSSATSAALLAAIAAWRGQPIDRSVIAEEGRRIEVEELGIAGGRQDHYAATYGGALALTFSTSTSVRRIDLSSRTRDAFCRRSVLVYTGESRISGDTITAVLNAYERGERRVLQALRRMSELAREIAVALEGADLDAVGDLLGEHWQHQRSLHSTIPTQRIDDIIAVARHAGARGGKAMGASGGGCVLLLCPDGGADAVRLAVGSLGELLDFRLDEGGVVVEPAAA
ncbi:MAG TPA: hypothetical protein VJ867_14970 [Gemmatimonadaceae bacterium]|nr:hypothetical protein [Gemmatimonadaceae bacterium]